MLPICGLMLALSSPTTVTAPPYISDRDAPDPPKYAFRMPDRSPDYDKLIAHLESQIAQMRAAQVPEKTIATFERMVETFRARQRERYK
jgi:hypothetical protein